MCILCMCTVQLDNIFSQCRVSFTMHSCQRSVLLIFIACAALCVRCPVDAYISGAPPESCDTMRAVHQRSRSFNDCAGPSLCPAITIDGVDVVNNMFQYNCDQNYTCKPSFSHFSVGLKCLMIITKPV